MANILKTVANRVGNFVKDKRTQVGACVAALALMASGCNSAGATGGQTGGVTNTGNQPAATAGTNGIPTTDQQPTPVEPTTADTQTEPAGELPIAQSGCKDETLACLAAEFQDNNWKVSSLGKYVVSCNRAFDGHSYTFTFALPRADGSIVVSEDAPWGSGDVIYPSEEGVAYSYQEDANMSCAEQ